jgi:hypothetical protein
MLHSASWSDFVSPNAVLINADIGQRIELAIEIQQHVVAVEQNNIQYETLYSILVPTSI